MIFPCSVVFIQIQAQLTPNGDKENAARPSGHILPPVPYASFGRPSLTLGSVLSQPDNIRKLQKRKVRFDSEQFPPQIGQVAAITSPDLYSFHHRPRCGSKTFALSTQSAFCLLPDVS